MSSNRRVRSRQLYNLAERDAYHAFVARHGPIQGGQKGFRKLLRDRGWKVAHHYATRAVSQEDAERERAFVEEGLERFGQYTFARYPTAIIEEDLPPDADGDV